MKAGRHAYAGNQQRRVGIRHLLRGNVSLRRAFDALYKSLLYQEVSRGVSDMHCRSDEYLAEELKREWGAGAA